MTLTIPDRLYQFIVLTWVSVIVGVTVVFGGRYVEFREDPRPVVSSQDSQMVDAIRKTCANLQSEMLIYRRALRDVDPDNPVLQRNPLLIDMHVDDHTAD